MLINMPLTRTAASIALVLGTLASAPAYAVPISTINIGGVSVDGGTVTTIATTVGAGQVTAIEFDIDVEHFPISWGEETVIQITAPDSTTYIYDGENDFGFGIGAGVWSFAGSFPITATAALGTWSFDFTDDFSDAANPDHTYLTGSTITLSGTTTAVPISSSLSLMVGGLGAWGFLRRRKKLV